MSSQRIQRPGIWAFRCLDRLRKVIHATLFIVTVGEKRVCSHWFIQSQMQAILQKGRDSGESPSPGAPSADEPRISAFRAS